MSRAVAFELPLGEVVETNWPGHGCGWILKRSLCKGLWKTRLMHG